MKDENEALEHRGRCLCGDITFVARGAPIWVVHCHCRSCRLNTGSAMATFVGYRTEQVAFAGDRSSFASSPGVSRCFCARCGTPVSFEAEHYPGEIHLYIGAFDDPESLPARGHVHYDEHIHWLEIADELPRKPGAGT